MLVGSGVRLSCANPMRQFAAPLAGSAERTAWAQAGSRRNSFQAFNGKYGYPSGVRHPVSWCMAPKAGGLSARYTITGSGGVTNANLWAVKLAQAALTGSGELTALGGLIVQLIAAITGSGTVTAANLQAFLAAAANLTGSGTISDADLEGLGALLAALVGDGTLDTSVLTGIGELDADLVVTGTGLSTANVGQAVWAALAAANNSAGTMGALLNGGSAGGLTTEQAAQLLEIFQRLGLDIDKPLTQTATEISTDDWTLTVTEGVGTVTVERQ